MRLLIFSVFFLLQSYTYSQLPVLDSIYPCNYNLEGDETNFIVMDFWATYCQPCIRSFPHMNSVHESLDRDDVKFISVSHETSEVIDKFLENNEIAGCIGIDEDFDVLQSFGYRAIPRVIIINKAGEKLWDGLPLELSKKKLSRILGGHSVIDEDKYFKTNVNINHSKLVDSSSISLTASSKMRSITFKNHTMFNVVENILGLRDNASYDLIIEGLPQHRGNIDFVCEVDSAHFSKEDFYNFCISNLMAASKSEIRDTFIDSKVMQISVEDTDKLLQSITTADKFNINRNPNYLIMEYLTLSDAMDDLSYRYNLPYSLENLKDIDSNLKFDFKFRVGEIDELIKEFEQYGLNLELIDGTKKEYILDFNNK